MRPRLWTATLMTLVIAAGACTADPIRSGGPTAGTEPAPTASASGPAASPPDGTQPVRLVSAWTCLACIYPMGTMVFDDGLVLREPDGAVIGRRLTPAGLDWVRRQLSESPLSAGPASYTAVPAPGATPAQREHTPHHFLLGQGELMVSVLSDVAAEYDAEPGAWQIPDQVRELDALAANLAEPDAWVPEGMWADNWRPWRPDRYLLLVDPQRDSQPEAIDPGGAPDADAVPWPWFGRIDEIGASRPGGDPLGERCLVVPAGEVALLAAAERSFGAERSLDVPYVSVTYPWRRGNGIINVATRWLLPHEPSSCAVGENDW
jgi:hypothetical protein